MFYYFLCGGKFTTKTITYILDKRRFPIFRIKKFFFPKSKTVNFDDKLKINADIEGNITNYKKGNKFYIFTNIEKYNINTTYMMECFTGIPSETGIEYNITCYLDVIKKFDNIYVLPYYAPYSTVYPYEVIIKEEIKGQLSSNYYKISFGFMLLFILLF